MKPKKISAFLITQTRPDVSNFTAARSCVYTTPDKQVLLKTKLNCGSNEYGFAFIASFKYVKNRLLATLTPGISTSSEDGKSFEFMANTNLVTSFWI